jgi:hypothetical protein
VRSQAPLVVGRFESYTCDRCGYREWYARRIEELADDQDLERVCMPPAATQLMRLGWPCWKCRATAVWLERAKADEISGLFEGRVPGGILPKLGGLGAAICGACGFVESSVERIYELGREPEHDDGVALTSVTDDATVTPCGLCSSARIWVVSLDGEHLEICNACGHVLWIKHDASN